MQTTDNKSLADRGAWVSILAYLLLSFLKITSGYMLDSKALVADGWNNTTDIMASVAVLIGLKISRKPPDDNHPYGHSRAETIASLAASFIMVSIGVQVLFSAVKSIFAEDKVQPDPIAAAVAVIGAIVMIGVYLYNRSLALKTKSQALMAAAKDNLSDALVSVGAFVGIIGAQFRMVWLDPLAAFVVGVVICKTAWDIFSESSHMLTDGFEQEKLLEYEETIKQVKGVKKITDVKARMLGNEVIVDVVIEVDPTLSIVESHYITDCIEEKLLQVHSIKTTHIHMEPLAKTDKV